MPSITLQGRPIEYRLLRTRLNRYVRLTVTLGKGLRVSVPPRYPAKDIPRIIHERSTWILEKLDEYANIERQTPRQRYCNGADVVILGRTYRLKISASSNGTGVIQVQGDDVEITVPTALSGSAREQYLKNALLAWYRIQAQRILPPRVEYYAQQMRVKPGRVTIRRQRSRWGSCSANGNLNLNVFLITLPVKTLDYVLVHELAHLLELNHSPRFWRIVERWCPERKKHQSFLRANIHYLEM